MKARAVQLWQCQFVKAVTLSNSRVRARTHLHLGYTMEISQTQINNARAVITPQSTVTQRKRKSMTKKQGEDKKDGVCVVRVTGQRGPHIVPRLGVGRKRRPGQPLSKRPPCFMHSVLCDDKHQRGGWNVGLHGPKRRVGLWGAAWGKRVGGWPGCSSVLILQPSERSLSSLPDRHTGICSFCRHISEHES